jgi:hypothetical protein
MSMNGWATTRWKRLFPRLRKRLLAFGVHPHVAGPGLRAGSLICAERQAVTPPAGSLRLAVLRNVMQAAGADLAGRHPGDAAAWPTLHGAGSLTVRCWTTPTLWQPTSGKQDGRAGIESLSPRELSQQCVNGPGGVGVLAVLSTDGNLVAGQPWLLAQSLDSDGAPHKFANTTFNKKECAGAACCTWRRQRRLIVVVAETTQSRTSLLQRLLAYCIARRRSCFAGASRVVAPRHRARPAALVVQLQTAME